MLTVATWNVVHRIHGENWDERVVKQLRRLAALVDDAERPAVVLGDFNASLARVAAGLGAPFAALDPPVLTCPRARASPARPRRRPSTTCSCEARRHSPPR